MRHAVRSLVHVLRMFGVAGTHPTSVTPNACRRMKKAQLSEASASQGTPCWRANMHTPAAPVASCSEYVWASTVLMWRLPMVRQTQAAQIQTCQPSLTWHICPCREQVRNQHHMPSFPPPPSAPGIPTPLSTPHAAHAQPTTGCALSKHPASNNRLIS